MFLPCAVAQIRTFLTKQEKHVFDLTGRNSRNMIFIRTERRPKTSQQAVTC